MAKTISIQQLQAACGDGAAALLDVRPMAAYNGWALRGGEPGGHISGARPFPLDWFGQLAGGELLQALRELEISPDDDLIVYGHGADDALQAARDLERLGHRCPRVFADGLSAWASWEGDGAGAPPARTLERLPRYRQLVHPEWLAQALQGAASPRSEGGRLVLAHVSFDNRDDYDLGHIPGAIALDTLFLEEPEHWNRRHARELGRALLDQGITCDATVVLYGRHSNPSMEHEHPGRFAGQLAAMRAALLLLYAGVEDVRILDGGLGAWLASGRSLTTERTAPRPAESFGRPIPACPGFVVDIDETREILADPMGELVSMQSYPEFIGEKSGYHYVGPRGRIPGAVFGNCGSDAYHMQNYRNHDHTMRCYHQIAERWQQVGIVPRKRVAFYCGTGWRASEAFFYAYLMGWDRIAIYDGGWFEWSLDAGNPIETGVPQGPLINSPRY
jgi:thiosulfate/3-mercaptopyruvate sulfurtransferase